MERDILEEGEVRYIHYIPDITTWTKHDTVVWPGDLANNPVSEVSEKSIMIEILNMMNEKGFTDWEVVSYETSYTKNTKLNKEGLAGRFWLVLKVFLKRKKQEGKHGD